LWLKKRGSPSLTQVGLEKNLSPEPFAKVFLVPFSVIPAKAGIQCFQCILDPGFRQADGGNQATEERAVQGTMIPIKKAALERLFLSARWLVLIVNSKARQRTSPLRFIHVNFASRAADF
jgi:hypothetical protein